MWTAGTAASGFLGDFRPHRRQKHALNGGHGSTRQAGIGRVKGAPQEYMPWWYRAEAGQAQPREEQRFSARVLDDTARPGSAKGDLPTGPPSLAIPVVIPVVISGALEKGQRVGGSSTST